jgi:hypothetical protein
MERNHITGEERALLFFIYMLRYETISIMIIKAWMDMTFMFSIVQLPWNLSLCARSVYFTP